LKLVDAATIRSIDEDAIKIYGMDDLVLMENAGRGTAEIILRELSDKTSNIAVISGKGNNGGDGYVVARYLANYGLKVTLFILTELNDIKGAALQNLNIWRNMGGDVAYILSEKEIAGHEAALRHATLIVDSIFGTGLSSEIRGHYAKMIDLINELGKTVISIDVPSGLDSSTGRILGRCVKAKWTATMAASKIGLFLYPGAYYAGKVEIVDIGIPRILIENKGISWNLIDNQGVADRLIPYSWVSHKGSFGHLLVLGASPGKTGAVCLTAMGAMRCGSGLVTIGIPGSLNPIVETKTTEVMTCPLPETASCTLGDVSFEAIEKLMGGKAAIAIGPGLMSTYETTGLLVKVLENTTIPLVVDADAINAIAGCTECLARAGSDVILTPHPGEMARLASIETKAVQRDRVGVAKGFALKNNVIVVLKGARTVIASPEGEVFINPTGNPGMATAGTGDVLTGIIGGFLAQGYKPLDAAIVGVYIHGSAGDLAMRDKGVAGMIATDLLNRVPKALVSMVDRNG